MNAINDGNLNVGIGDDVTILEVGEKVSLNSKKKAFPGSARAVKDTKGNTIGHVFSKDAPSMDLEFQGQIGSLIDEDLEPFNQISFIDAKGYGWVFPGVDVAYSSEDVPKISGIAVRMVNGLITAPASDVLGLKKDSEMEAFQAVVTTDVSTNVTDASWSISGVSGLSISATGSITGTPTDDAGDYELKIVYSCKVKGVLKSSSRIIDVKIAAAA